MEMKRRQNMQQNIETSLQKKNDIINLLLNYCYDKAEHGDITVADLELIITGLEVAIDM